MKILATILAALLFPLSSIAAEYCVRADGTSTKANATSCTATSTSMSLATFNASTFSAGDIINFSSRGGNFGAVTFPSSGSSGNPILYRGETGYLPTFIPSSGSAITCNQSYVTLTDLKTDHPEAIGMYSLHFASGELVGVETNNLVIKDPPSEAIRHETQITVTHNNLSISGSDEPLTTHSISAGTITVNGGTITGYGVGGAVRGSPGSVTNWVLDGVTFTAGSGGLLISSTNRSTGTYFIKDCVIADLGTTRGWDLRSTGILTMYNNIILSTTTGDYYILPKDGSLIYNNTFVGPGTSNLCIFNNAFTSASKIKNNIFKSFSQALYGTTGDIDYNLFYNAGTTRGTNIVTGDPLIDANGKIASVSSPAIGVGVDLSGTFTNDIDGDTRNASAFGLGADYYVNTETAFPSTLLMGY